MKSSQLPDGSKPKKMLQPAKVPSRDPSPLLLPPKNSRDQPVHDSKIQHPNFINQNSEIKSEQKESSQKSTTAKLESKFSSSSEPMIDNRVVIPTFAIITRVPFDNPIEVALYGDAQPSMKSLLGHPYRLDSKRDHALVIIKDTLFKINYSMQNIQPSIILYFPCIDYPLTNIDIPHRALFKIEYEELEDAETAKIYLRECGAFVNHQDKAKCAPELADGLIAYILKHLRKEYLLRHQGIRVTADPPQQNNSSCCHS